MISACIAENAFNFKGWTTPLFREPKPIKADASGGSVYICSPFRGDTERNMQNAERYCRLAFDNGFISVAPHIYFPRFLDDNNPAERAVGMRYGLKALRMSKQLWVFGLRISEGMRAEIDLAKKLKIRIRYFDTDTEEIDGQYIR